MVFAKDLSGCVSVQGSWTDLEPWKVALAMKWIIIPVEHFKVALASQFICDLIMVISPGRLESLLGVSLGVREEYWRYRFKSDTTDAMQRIAGCCLQYTGRKGIRSSRRTVRCFLVK
jgi:hypothetical protein